MWIINAIKWFAGFFEDQKGSASSKRATLYICLFFMYMQIKAGIDGKIPDTTMNYYMYWGNVILIAFCIGMITSELAGSLLSKVQETKKTETTKTEETKEKTA